MGNRFKKAAAAAAALLMAFSLCGCAMKSAEELYTLPQFSEGYIQLQEKINAVLASGAEYSAPQSGSNRQAVQLDDLDGDGAKEAVAFFSVSGSSKPQKIYIFRSSGESYEQTAVIEGEGSGISSVNYADMNGDGVKEIVVGWQIASGVKLLCAYSIRGGNVSQLFSTDYTEYTVSDLNGDGNADLLILRLASADTAGEAELYSLSSSAEVVRSVARLSKGAESLLRVRNAVLSDGKRAVYTESLMSDESIVTDIFICRSGTLANLTLSNASGVSDGTIRADRVYCRDVDGDGVLDVPEPVLLPSLSGEDRYYDIEWYSYSSGGIRTLVTVTYSNYSDNWYLALPAEWRGHITVRREDSVSGERTIIFSYIGAGGVTDARDFLAVYTLTGDNGAERAQASGRFTILSEGETIYAGELLTKDSGFPLQLSEKLVRDNFHIIYSEWITGET